MPRLYPHASFLVLLSVTAASGGIAGAFNHRWGTPTDMAAAGQRVEQCPDRFGPWEMLTAEPFEPGVQEILECVGSTHRTYRNRETGETVQLALLVGPAGPTSVHTPDVCFSSQDYSSLGPRKRVAVGSRGASVWEQQFKATSLRGETLRVAYAWNSGQGWIAAEKPRFQFAGAGLLYKLQVVSPVTRGDDEAESATSGCRAFLKDLLPALDAAVVRPAQADPS